MKITEIRTRVVEWRGKTVPPQPHFCTNPMDILDLPADVAIGNELFWYIFDGEPTPVNGYIDLKDDVPGLGVTIKEDALGQ